MRRGVAYIVESFVAMLMLFVFAIGAQSTAESQDWSSYSLQVEAQDLTEVVEATGGLDVLERGETGTFRTFARHVSGGDLAVSGSVDIPVDEFSIGFPVLPDQRQSNRLEGLDPSGCEGELNEDIENESGDIRKPQNDMFNARLYVADTDPRSASGNGVVDYDTLYVDNGTKCQLNRSQGPFYLGDYFNYSNGSSGRLFQFKGVDEEGASRDLIYHNASQVARFRDLTKKQLNGIETSLSFDTINISEASLPDYQLLVFRRDDSLSELIAGSSSGSSSERINTFSDRGGSILLLMNLEESDFGSGSFLSSTDLDWVGMSKKSLSASASPEFTEGSASVSTKDFFLGMGGNPGGITLPPEGRVSSHGSQATVEEPVLAYEDAYNGVDWNVSNRSMSEVEPGNVEGEPESGCYSNGGVKSSNLTRGNLSLPTSTGTVDRRAISAELGKDDGFCQNNDVRALMIDYDDDGEFETSEDEGPFVEGDTVVRAGREYSIALSGPSTVELVFAGSTHLEAVNYLESHRSGELARMAYQESYSPDNRMLVTAVMYKLLPDNSAFGSDAASVPLSVLSSTNKSFYMPYTASLRWGEA